MPGIYIAAIVAGALAFAAIGSFLAKGARSEERRLYVVLLILQLPMSALAFTAVAVVADARAAVLLPLGFVGAAALHFIGNFPLYLASRRLFGLTQEHWQLLLYGWTIVYTVALALLLHLLARVSGTRFFPPPMRKCRHCGEDYKAPIMSLNLGAWRYERCSRCGKSQWV